MLFLVATPIGNLADITFRAVETLKKVELIYCEDTRRTKILLSHYGIEKPLKSFHKFSESKEENALIQKLQGGADIAIVSDAGTPGISDPGQRLVERCQKENIPYTTVPGPSAPLVAISLSGLDSSRFQFLGFLPKKEGERKKLLLDSLFYPGVTLFFESPQRIQKTLGELKKMGPDHQLVIARELTKQYEELLRGRAEELINKELRGEIVLLIEGHKKVDFSLPIEDHVKQLMTEFSLTKQEAIKLCADLRGLSKREVYACFISEE